MIAKWIVVAWLALGALVTIAFVGKPRKPLTAGQAVVNVAVTAAFIVTIVLAWPSA